MYILMQLFLIFNPASLIVGLIVGMIKGRTQSYATVKSLSNWPKLQIHLSNWFCPFDKTQFGKTRP